jgi:succinate-semialdehyde dehydrogenase/glutarate-semialdehyde dehydrogenase
MSTERHEQDPPDSHTVLNPADARPVAEVHLTSLEEADAAIERAAGAFRAWRDVAPGARAALLRRFAAVVDAHIDELAELEVRNAGHTWGNARWEAGNVRDVLNYYSAAPERLFGRQIPVPGGVDVTFREPLGVVGVIVPWNFPMPIAGWGFAPALAAGNTVVLKPAELTPLTGMRIGELALEAGLPEGVLTVLPGKGSVVGERFVTHPLVRKVCFTGSTEVGKTLIRQCAGTVKKVTMELGGNAPFIVFDDADLDAAVEGAIASKYRNTGQTCVCANRLLVQDSVYDDFVGRLAEKVGAMKVGSGFDEGVVQGPLIDMKAVAKVEEHIADALEKGARVVVGGKRHELGGSFFQPTVLADVTPKMQVAREETFGPMAPVFRFSTEEEAVRMANDTEFGLASYFYARDLGRVWRVGEGLDYGIVGINTGLISTPEAPFGGMKESGLGREGSKYGIEDYLEVKYMCMGGI